MASVAPITTPQSIDTTWSRICEDLCLGSRLSLEGSNYQCSIGDVVFPSSLVPFLPLHKNTWLHKDTWYMAKDKAIAFCLTQNGYEIRVIHERGRLVMRGDVSLGMGQAFCKL